MNNCMGFHRGWLCDTKNRMHTRNKHKESLQEMSGEGWEDGELTRHCWSSDVDSRLVRCAIFLFNWSI